MFPVWFMGHFSNEWSWSKTENVLWLVQVKARWAHNSWEIIIWVGNNYCPKADIFGRQSLAITAQVVLRLDSAVTRIKIYSANNAIGFPNPTFEQPGGQPINLQQQQDQSFSRVLTGPDTGLRIWTHLDLFTTGLFRDFTLTLLSYSVLNSWTCM